MEIGHIDLIYEILNLCEIMSVLLNVESVANKKHFDHSGKDQLLKSYKILHF